MKRWIAFGSVLTLVCTASGMPSWERELREMGYAFLHLSNINVINGLNLTKDQARKLRRLAKRVESVAEEPPGLRARVSDEWQAIRKDWLAVRDLLVAGKPIPEELEKRVTASRFAESALIKGTILPDTDIKNTSCAGCHASRKRREAGKEKLPEFRPPTYKRLTALAHMEAIYGRRGLAELIKASPEVETILTDGQKAILGEFSCCLVPPDDLSNPVRAGQAGTSQEFIEALRKIRQCPERHWPMARDALMMRIDRITAAVSPGANATRKQIARDEILRALERARSLSNIEFELEKGQLARTAKAALMPDQGENWPHKAAYFLLIPGASKVYGAYMNRLGKQARHRSGTR